MIVRTWCGKVPPDQADSFYHLWLATCVRDYRRQAGCVDVALWHRDEDARAIFTLVSTWRDLAHIRACACDDPECAMLYPDDGCHGLVPDLSVRHHCPMRIGQ